MNDLVKYFLLLIYISIILVCHGKTDYYETLGLRRSASSKEIKASFRNLARKWWVDMFMLLLSLIAIS